MPTTADPSLITDVTATNGRPPRLLLVAYSFPPVGGAGVQRPVKWVKNLRRLGWDVTVLTTENPSVPTRDESLLADIPEDVLVVRAKTWEPDYRIKQGLQANSTQSQASFVSRAKSAIKGFVKEAGKLMLQPDPQVLWVANAISAGKRVLRELTHDAILVTAPPYSSFFVGTALKKQFGLPLILDFRDEWDLSGRYLENAQRDFFSSTIQSRMQRHVLKQADAVIATTKASTSNLAEKLIKLKKASTPTAAIYNGFDAEEFETAAESSPPASNRRTFRLIYTGTLWNLTSIEPLVSAIERLQLSSPAMLSRLELVCVGRKTPEQAEILARVAKTGCRLELVDYCEHAKVLEYLQSTDGVCLLLSDVPGAERVVPAKLFEYLAIRKDILAIVPNGETSDIVRRFFPTGSLEPKNIDGIAEWLKVRLAGISTEIPLVDATQSIDEFSRLTQTQMLVELLNNLVGDRSHEKNKVRT